MKYTVVFAFFLYGVVYSAITCPTLACDEPIGGDYCFLHSGDSPVTEIRTFKCPSNQWCYLEKGKFAWVTSTLQWTSLSRDLKQNSQVFQRYTEKHCEYLGNFQQQL